MGVILGVNCPQCNYKKLYRDRLGRITCKNCGAEIAPEMIGLQQPAVLAVRKAKKEFEKRFF